MHENTSWALGLFESLMMNRASTVPGPFSQLQFPPFPTTSIGSFPQTAEVGI